MSRIVERCCGIEIPNEDGYGRLIEFGDYVVLDDGGVAYYNPETDTFISEDGKWESVNRHDAPDYFMTPFEYLREAYGDVFYADIDCILGRAPEIKDYIDLTNVIGLKLYITTDDAWIETCFVDPYKPCVDAIDIYDLRTLMAYLDDFLECSD